MCYLQAIRLRIQSQVKSYQRLKKKKKKKKKKNGTWCRLA